MVGYKGHCLISPRRARIFYRHKLIIIKTWSVQVAIEDAGTDLF
jgi:hypothetical protein